MMPTLGPWKVREGRDIRVGPEADPKPGSVSIDGYGWLTLASVYNECAGDAQPEGDANAAIIVAAVNACFAQNASDPIKVAENIVKMVESLLRTARKCRCFDMEHSCEYVQARAILTACGIEWKERGK